MAAASGQLIPGIEHDRQQCPEEDGQGQPDRQQAAVEPHVALCLGQRNGRCIREQEEGQGQFHDGARRLGGETDAQVSDPGLTENKPAEHEHDRRRDRPSVEPSRDQGVSEEEGRQEGEGRHRAER